LKNSYFKGDTYKTSADTGRVLGDKLLLGTRFYFHVRYMSIIYRYRNLALKGLFGRKEWVSSSNEIFKAIEECGGRFNITGLSNLSKDSEPVVIVANHMSNLENMVLPGIVDPIRSVTFVIKEEILKVPFFSSIMKSTDPIALSRKNPREDLKKVLTEGSERLKNGKSIILFPQSTRLQEFKPENMNSLGVKLARKAGVKVVPLAIKTDFWEMGKILKDFGPISRDKEIFLSFGEPLEIAGNGSEEHRKVIDFISKKTAEWTASK